MKRSNLKAAALKKYSNKIIVLKPIIVEIHVLNPSVKKLGYCILRRLYTPSVRACEKNGQSDNNMIALIGSIFVCLP